MGFDKFGTVSFTDESKAVDFVTYLEQGKVMATRCKRCSTQYFPPKMDCPSCLGSDIEWFQIEDSGKLATYTEVNYGPTGFEDDTPYTLAIVDFEDGLRVFGRLSRSIRQTDIRIGMALKPVAVKLASGRVSYEFAKA